MFTGGVPVPLSGVPVPLSVVPVPLSGLSGVPSVSLSGIFTGAQLVPGSGLSALNTILLQFLGNFGRLNICKTGNFATRERNNVITKQKGADQHTLVCNQLHIFHSARCDRDPCDMRGGRGGARCRLINASGRGVQNLAMNTRGHTHYLLCRLLWLHFPFPRVGL